MSAPVENPGGEVRVYEAADGEVRVDVRLDHETVWLTQEQMSQLFGRERSVITKHVRNVFRERELEPGATCAKFAQVQTEGTEPSPGTWTTTTSMSSSPSATASSQTRARASANGLPPRISLSIDTVGL